jgi:hypothetical protein
MVVTALTMIRQYRGGCNLGLLGRIFQRPGGSAVTRSERVDFNLCKTWPNGRIWRRQRKKASSLERPSNLSQQSAPFSVPASVPKLGPRSAKQQPTPTNKPIKNGPEIVNLRPVL